MKIVREELRKALDVVKPALASKEIIDQSGSFVFTGTSIITYNDEISINHPFITKFKGAVKADELLQFLNKSTKKQFIILKKGNELIFKAARMRAGFILNKDVKLPLDEIVEPEEFFPVPDSFITGLKFVIQASSRDMSRPVLTCIHLRSDYKVEASDGHCIAQYKVPELPVGESLLLPADAARFVIGQDPTLMAYDQNWLYFKNEEGTLLSCRLFDRADKFPNTEEHLNVKGSKFMLPEKIAMVCETASIFAAKDNYLEETLILSFDKNELKVEGKNEYGWYEEVLPVDYTKKPMAFTITPYLLEKVLQLTDKGIVSENKIKFKGADWVYLAMLRG